MILSARVVLKPQLRQCDECGRFIHGPQLKLYGAAHRGERPYNLHLHLTCVALCPDSKVKAAIDRYEQHKQVQAAL